MPILLVIVVYVAMLLSMLGLACVMRKSIDKIAEEAKKNHQNSLEIVSQIKTNDKPCDIEEMFEVLEKNNIDMSCKHKVN